MSRFAPVWLFVATVAFAQEKASPAAEKSPPPAEDAIAAAKRDFNTIKSVRGAVEQPKADLPALTAPELHSDAPLPRMQSSPALDPKAAKKSTNWLVDAMMKPDEKESRDPREKLSNSVGTERERIDAEDRRVSTDSRVAEMKKNDAQLAEKRVGPEFNPLTQYMAGWMTTQDYNLLKPGLDGAAAASLTTRGDPSLPAVGSNLSTLGDTGSALDLGAANKAAPFALPKPADNPFLQSLNSSGLVAASGFMAPPAPSSGPVSSALAPVPVEVAPAKSRIPDFAKPAMDEKYFKQLKRF